MDSISYITVVDVHTGLIERMIRCREQFITSLFKIKGGFLVCCFSDGEIWIVDLQEENKDPDCFVAKLELGYSLATAVGVGTDATSASDNRIAIAHRTSAVTILDYTTQTQQYLPLPQRVTSEGVPPTFYVLFSLPQPNSHLLFGGTIDGEVCMWNLNTSKIAQVHWEHKEPVRKIVLLADGRLLSSSYNSMVAWNFTTGEIYKYKVNTQHGWGGIGMHLTPLPDGTVIINRKYHYH